MFIFFKILRRHAPHKSLLLNGFLEIWAPPLIYFWIRHWAYCTTSERWNLGANITSQRQTSPNLKLCVYFLGLFSIYSTTPGNVNPQTIILTIQWYAYSLCFVIYFLSPKSVMTINWRKTLLWFDIAMTLTWLWYAIWYTAV